VHCSSAKLLSGPAASAHLVQVDDLGIRCRVLLRRLRPKCLHNRRRHPPDGRVQSRRAAFQEGNAAGQGGQVSADHIHVGRGGGAGGAGGAEAADHGRAD
jgi:hypothetical protein